MGLQQRGGGRGRPQKIPIRTPKGVQKSQPSLSESGHHRRTTYKRGDVEAVFTETIPPITAPESLKSTIRVRNHRNKADLMSLFNEVSGASAEKDMAHGGREAVTHTAVEGPQRPNLKSEDSGLRHRFSEAKVSLWMCENGTGHEESRGPTRR